MRGAQAAVHCGGLLVEQVGVGAALAVERAVRVEQAVGGNAEYVVGHHRVEDGERIGRRAALGARVAVVVVELVGAIGVPGRDGERPARARFVQIVDALNGGEQGPLVLDRAAEQVDILAAALAHGLDRQRFEEAALDDRREGHQVAAGQGGRFGVGHQRVLRVEHILRGDTAQRLGVVGVDLEHRAEAASDLSRHVNRQRMMASARLRDGSVEESLRLGGSEQHADAHSAGRLAEDRDVVGIAAEAGDVVAHPAQRGHLVAHAVVAAVRVVAVGERLVVEVAQRAEAVVDRDQHDVAAPGEVLAVVDRRRAGAAGEAAAVDPDHHRARRVVDAGRPDVEREAVFVDRLFPGAEQFDAGHEGLHRAGAELVGLAHAVPGFGIARRAPAQLAQRRRGVGNAAEDGDVVFLASRDSAVFRCDGGRHGVLLHSVPCLFAAGSPRGGDADAQCV